MFAGWQSFYQVTGAAAAQLIGLLFIVATLTRQRPNPASERGRRLFTTPVVVELALVLLISGLALAPDSEHAVTSAVMACSAFACCIYAALLLVRHYRNEHPTHWTDFWYYGAATAAANLALAASTVCALADLPHAACATGLSLLALLMLSIRNAWDLVTWLAARPTPEDDQR